MQPEPSDRPTGKIVRFTPRPRRDPSDGRPLSYFEWRRLTGQGDAQIEVDVEALRRWFGYDARDAATHCADLLPAGGGKRASDADAAVTWWRGHAGGLLDCLTARGVPYVVARRTVAAYTSAVRHELNEIHETRRSADEWKHGSLAATVGLSMHDGPSPRPRGRSGDG